MQKRLFVHVGYPKTGTSTLQRAFDRERRHLLDAHGLLYPEACVARPEFGHHNIAWEATDQPLFDPTNGGTADLWSEIERLDPPRVLVSSEALVDCLVEFPAHFRTAFEEALPDFALTIVVVIRRIDEYVESSFAQQFNAWMWDRPISRSTAIDDYVDGFDVDRHLAPLRVLFDSDYHTVFLPHGPGILGVFESLGAWSGERIVAPNRARALLDRAWPIYQEIGHDFTRALIGDGTGADWEAISLDATFDPEEAARINDFFDRRVVGHNS